MKKETVIDARIVGFYLLLIFVIIASILMKNCRDTYTPHEYMDALRAKDSIELTQGNGVRREQDIREFVNDKIRQNKNIQGVIENCVFDNNMGAWEVSYSYAMNKDLDEDGTTLGKNIIEKVVWIKMDFNYNNGEYILKPKIIKTGRRKKPTYVHPDHQIDVIRGCKKTYEE